MTRENWNWLSTQTAHGFVDRRPPWWLKYAEREGWTPNVYPGAVPMEEVKRLLCSWRPYTTELLDAEDVIFAINQGHAGADLLAEIERTATITTHKNVKADDDRSRLGLVGIETAQHAFDEWIVGTVVETVRPDELEVSSVGLLRNRAQAWVQIERPESSVGPNGIKFSPSITLSGSLDSSMASQINQNTTNVECDNTMDIARGQGVSFKATSGSQAKLGMYRSVMTAILQGETDFKKTLEHLLSLEVPTSKLGQFLDKLVPINDDDKPAKKTRSDRKRQEITQLIKGGPAVTGGLTAWDIVQGVNTWNQHMSQLQNRTGYEMNDTNLRAMKVAGQRIKPASRESEDRKTMALLDSVLDGGHKSTFAMA